MKKIVALIALVATLSLTLVGCSKKDKGAQDTREIEVYYYKQENQAGLRKIITSFQNSNPKIKIKLLIIPNDGDATMSARAAQNKLPAIIQMQSYSRVTEYASKGYLTDVTDIDALRSVLPSSMASVTYNGRQYGVPMDYAGIGIIYNKDIFEKLGIQPPETYTQLQEVCNTLKQNGIVPFSALLKENWSAGHFITMIHTALLANNAPGTDADSLTTYYNQFIADMNAGKISYGGEIDTSRLFEILDFYHDNMNPTAAEMDGADQQRSFANGESAMMVQGLWSYVDAKKLNPKLNAGFIPFPVYDDAEKNKLYADVDSTFVISSQVDENQKKDAITFLNWLAGPEGKALWVSEYKLTHSFNDGNFESLGEPFNDLMTSVADKGAYPWLFSRYPSVAFEDACKNGSQQYMLKSLNAEKVISQIDEQWRANAPKDEATAEDMAAEAEAEAEEDAEVGSE